MVSWGQVWLPTPAGRTLATSCLRFPCSHARLCLAYDLSNVVLAELRIIL